jgi:MFS family permease
VLISLGTGMLGIGFAVMAGAHALAVAIAGSAIAGLGNGVHAVAARTALQEHVEQRWMALMMGLNESLIQGVPGAGIVLGGVVAELANPRVAFGVAAAGALVVTAVSWVVLRPAALRGGETLA